MNNEIIEHWKKRLIELDNKIKNLEAELEVKQSAKLKISFGEPYLSEQISYLKDWINFNLKERTRCEAKLKNAEQVYNKEIVDLEKSSTAFKLVFGQIEEEKPKVEVFEIKVDEKISRIKSIYQKPLIRYTTMSIILLLLIASFFLLRPVITGYVVLSEEKTYTENLNLEINESGNYTWVLDKPGRIESIRAAGSVSGNGSVKIYIEKDGKRYLIYKNSDKI